MVCELYPDKTIILKRKERVGGRETQEGRDMGIYVYV